MRRGRAAGRADPDRLGADAAGGSDVFGCIADHDDSAISQFGAELRGPPLRPASDQLDPQLVIAAEAAELEVMIDADVLELEPRALEDVAGAEPDGSTVGHGGSERLLDARVDSVGRAGQGELRLELTQVNLEQLVDIPLAGAGPDGLEAEAGDGAIGHALEAQLFAGIAAAVTALEGAIHGPAPDAAGRDQGAIDVEEQDGRALGTERGHGGDGVAITNRRAGLNGWGRCGHSGA